MGVIASENFGYLLDPGLRKIFMDEFQIPESAVIKLFSQEKSNKAVEYDYSIGGMGDLTEFDGTINYGDFQGQYRVSYTHKEWVRGIKIERKLVDDDQYGVINNRPKALALVTKRTEAKHACSIFNNAFNTSVFAGGDTYALCASAHTWKGTGTTQSNAGSTELSKTSLATARLAMRDFKDETDNILNVMGDTLVVPPELEEKAWEITMSDKTVDNANNNANFFKGRYKVIVEPYLTSSKNWFVVDSRYASLFLKWFNRIPAEFNKDKDFETYVAKWSAYIRYSFGFSSWPWIYGSEIA